MLISRVSEEGGAEGRPQASVDHSHEYQTASELFDLMAKNHPFDADVGETLSTRDLVILYKNIDLGTKLMSNAEELKLRRPNQHVETVVYHDDPDSEGSDVSEIYGTEDVKNIYSINNERLDLINSRPSLENILCQKLGDLEIQASNLSMEYDHHFLFKDPYIKEQLKNFNQMNGESDGLALPSSLLDYICCKRLEDNYNFYMDNIIRYVKHTIEHLKRISNGDFLTDKAKEKWREVENSNKDDDNTKVLATSTSIPLQVERKVNGHSTKWDDIIHSEVDIRSLSKILEKKIIVEVPKLICESYKLFSKLCSDNLIISCKKEDERVETENKEPRVNVVLQLERSETGQVMSNISSMFIVQATPPFQLDERPKALPLPYIDKNEGIVKELSQIENEQELTYTEQEEGIVRTKKVKIVEMPETNDETDENSAEANSDTGDKENEDDNMLDNETFPDNYCDDSKSNNSVLESGDSSVALRDILDTRAIPDILRKEAPFNFISPDDLSFSMHILNMSALPEESGENNMPQNPLNKKKSQTKVRIKSPYENKSHIMEEKKRKKLLEIREKREKRKMAIGENCKVNKHRYGKGGIMPQSSSSVTKLSITNKSFYNSIYGQNMSIDNKSIKSRSYKGKRDLSINPPLENLEGENDSPMLTPDANNQKYINRSYYLDETVTEMMFTQLRQSDCSSSVKEIFSASAVSAEFSGSMNKVDRPEPDPNEQQADSAHDNNFDCDNEKKDLFNEKSFNLPSGRTESCAQMKTSSRSILNVVPANSPRYDAYNEGEESPAKIVPTVECRKSIDKLYDLMKKLERIDQQEVRSSRSKLSNNISKNDAKVGQGSSIVQGSSIIQGSDSGTSLKHQLTSSNPSSYSFEKINNTVEIPKVTIKSNKKTDALTTVVPKVIISTKQQTAKVEVEKVKKDRKKVAMNPLHKVTDNPLKAISHLLHEFDSVQKNRQRPPSDSKASRKPDAASEDRSAPRQGSAVKRRSRIDQPARENEVQIDKNPRIAFPQNRRPRLNPAMEPLNIPRHQMPVAEKNSSKEEKHINYGAKDERHLDRITKKKIVDIIDEVKEAKGEAVRGPSKLNSRLNSLAQPKKSYVQAHSEEYQTKYGRNLMADRLQRLADSPAGPAGPARTRPRRPGTEAVPPVAVRPPPPPQPIERGPGLRRAGGPDAPARRPAHASDAPAPMKNKMEAVESYLKSHFRRVSPPGLRGHRARVPLVPTDLILGSIASSSPAEESTAIGSKLHRIIKGMLNATLNPKPTSLAAVAESHERDDLSLADKFSREPSSVDSYYRADIFEDKNVKTAVESFHEQSAGAASATRSERESSASSTELQRLEDALHGRMPVGPRLRINKLTLTPKQSMQQLLVVKSGDGSVVLKSTLSKSLIVSTSRSDATADLNTLPTFEKSQLYKNFHSNVPMQLSTVGYAFPDYHAAYCGPNSAIRSLDNIFKLGISVSSTCTGRNKKSDIMSQCFKGSQAKHNQDTIFPLNNVDVMPVSRKKPTNFASVATDAPTFNNDEKTCGDCTKMLKDKFQTEAEEPKVKVNVENVDCTSSLDMLVGLLNEIQKITTCHITDTVQYADKRVCGEVLDVVNGKAALKDTTKNINSHELVSTASLHKLRQLESSPSIYSLFLSDGDKESIEEKIGIPRLPTSIKNVLYNQIPSHVDKEVGADFPVREYMTTFTDVPSAFFPITVTHSTNVSNSLIGVLSKPSSQSIISLEEFQSAYSNPTFNCKEQVIEITEQCKIHEIFADPVIVYPKNAKKLPPSGGVVSENKTIATELHKVTTHINLLGHQTKCFRGKSDFDPLFKMKRDILVTMYSMLVLTVFAALSFPEILYHV